MQEELEKRGMPFTSRYAKTVVLGVIEGGKPGETVALRADMDALRTKEENEHDFISENEGDMHACGHAAHTAMLAQIAVDALYRLREE